MQILKATNCGHSTILYAYIQSHDYVYRECILASYPNDSNDRSIHKRATDRNARDRTARTMGQPIRASMRRSLK